MITRRMPFFLDALYQLRVFVDKASCHKEGSLNLMSFQYIQNGSGISGFVSCVKGQINGLLIRISKIKGIITCQLRLVCVPFRRLSLFPEAESPAFFVCHARGGSGKIRYLGRSVTEEKGSGQKKRQADDPENRRLFCHGQVSFYNSLSVVYELAKTDMPLPAFYFSCIPSLKASPALSVTL